MKAVAEVAANPSAIKKYANNKKVCSICCGKQCNALVLLNVYVGILQVQRFYASFGQMMGEKLEAIGGPGSSRSMPVGQESGRDLHNQQGWQLGAQQGKLEQQQRQQRQQQPQPVLEIQYK